MHPLPTAPDDVRPDADQIELLTRQLARERAARRQAEQLLEQKSLVLYHTNHELQALNLSLEARVEERTRELAQARDDALAATQAKSLFLANVSHELRTPLHAIINYTEMLEEDAGAQLPTESRRDLATILGAARHLSKMIDQILDFSKAEAGRIQTRIEAVDVAALAEQVMAMADSCSDQRGNTLQLILATPPGSMHTDPLRLRQCLLNLLSNAGKFTQNGEVTLTIQRLPTPVGEQLHFHVRDTGIGISPEQLSTLFQPFAQGDASISQRYGGTGLGLALTRQLATLLGGKVFVTSQPGVGSCFTLTLPTEPPAEPRQHDDLPP